MLHLNQQNRSGAAGEGVAGTCHCLKRDVVSMGTELTSVSSSAKRKVAEVLPVPVRPDLSRLAVRTAWNDKDRNCISKSVRSEQRHVPIVQLLETMMIQSNGIPLSNRDPLLVLGTQYVIRAWELPVLTFKVVRIGANR